MEVSMKLLGELESLGFPRARAVRGLHYSGNTNIEDAVFWLIDHENDPHIDQMPLVVINMDIESPQPNDITEAIKIKEQELRDRVRIKNREEEKKLEREREKERIRAGKALQEAKRIAEENERQRFVYTPYMAPRLGKIAPNTTYTSFFEAPAYRPVDVKL